MSILLTFWLIIPYEQTMTWREMAGWYIHTQPFPLLKLFSKSLYVRAGRRGETICEILHPVSRKTMEQNYRMKCCLKIHAFSHALFKIMEEIHMYRNFEFHHHPRFQLHHPTISPWPRSNFFTTHNFPFTTLKKTILKCIRTISLTMCPYTILAWWRVFNIPNHLWPDVTKRQNRVSSSIADGWGCCGPRAQ